jgi:hypothetical protein
VVQAIDEGGAASAQRIRTIAVRDSSVAVAREDEPLDDAERCADRLTQRP